MLTEAVEALSGYDFPGNVRELQNMVERAVALSSGKPVGPEAFHQELSKRNGDAAAAVADLPEQGVDLEAELAAVERRLLQQALRRSQGVKKEAAKLLGISFRSIRYRLLKHKLE